MEGLNPPSITSKCEMGGMSAHPNLVSHFNSMEIFDHSHPIALKQRTQLLCLAYNEGGHSIVERACSPLGFSSQCGREGIFLLVIIMMQLETLIIYVLIHKSGLHTCFTNWKHDQILALVLQVILGIVYRAVYDINYNI